MPSITFFPTDSAYLEKLNAVAAAYDGALLVSDTLDAHIAGTADKHAASAIVNTPAGGIAATDVQAAINELDTEKQPVNANLTALAGQTGAADKLSYWTAAATLALTSLTGFGRTMIAWADAAAARTGLGLGTLATQSGTFSGTSSGTNTGDQTSVTGSAGNAPAGTLTGATLAAGVTASSLTSLGTLTSLTTSGQITSSVSTGTAPFSVASTTNVANLNASSLSGATFAAPGTIGGGTPGAATFTTLTATGQVSLGGVAGAEGLRVTTTASAVNFLNVYGAVTAGFPGIFFTGSDANVNGGILTKGTGGIGLYTNSGSQLQALFSHTASAVNYATITGGATGVSPAYTVAGSDTNVGFNVSTKGSGLFRVFSNGYTAEQFRVVAVASAVNFLTVQGGVTGNGAIAYIAGADTNAGLSLSSKGSGPVGIYTNTIGSPVAAFAHTASAVNYVITFSGATGNGPTHQAEGSDSNVNFAHSLKGGGTHLFYTGSTSLIQFTVSHTASAVNRLNITGGGTGVNPVLSVSAGDTNRGFNMTSRGTGSINVYTNALSSRAAEFGHVASAVNYPQFQGGAAGVPVQITALGSDSAVGFAISAKGGAAIRLFTGGAFTNEAFRVLHTASSVNYPQALPSIAGAAAGFSVAGGDADIDFVLTPKGTNGRVKYGTHAAIGAETVTGYIEIKDAGGTVRKLAVVS